MNSDVPAMSHAIVLIHGWEGNASSWVAQIRFLEARGFNCLAVQMPGWDLPDPPDTWGVPEYAEFVLDALTKRFPNQRVILVGHSFGGRLAIWLAAHYPQLVEALILSSAAGVQVPVAEERRRHFFVASVARWARSLLGVPLFRAVRELFVRAFGSQHYKTASFTMREVLKNVINRDLAQLLPMIKCKTLIVWGEEDQVIAPDSGKFICDHIPLAKWSPIPGA